MLTNSTLSNNTAGREGGAIKNYFANLKMTNSTISGNATDGNGGGIWNLGTLKITNSTLMANLADADGNATGDGGGIFDDGSSTAPVMNASIDKSNWGGGQGCWCVWIAGKTDKSADVFGRASN